MLYCAGRAFRCNLEEGELTKEEFGRIMHDPSATDEEIAEALKALQDAGGYENLGD